MPVFLATDVLLWLLVAAALAYFLHCRRHAHLAAPWRRVLQSRAALVSLVVLAAFAAVGLLDSLHFRPRLAGTQVYSNEVLSLLDLPLAHLRSNAEKTYSAPFAIRLYSKEQIETADGKSVRDYPRLAYGGRDLKNDSERPGDIARRAAAGAALALALTVAFHISLRRARRRHPDIPWSAAVAALGALLVLAVPLYALSFEYHVFGTDKVGQDVLYEALKSVRTAIVIGTLSTLVMLPFGIGLGIVAGYFKGWVDDLIQYVYTTLNSIPAVLLIAAAVLMMQVYIDTHAGSFPTAAQRADFRLLMLCLILGVTSWTGLTRLLRGEALKLSSLDFIQAAHAFGVADARILARHILPNVAHIVVISLVMDFSGLVLAEAVLSYVGVGVDPATTSFGTMINAARLEMGRDPIVWWSLAAAFAFMLLLVLAANLFADAVRDGFDPRVRVGAAPA